MKWKPLDQTCSIRSSRLGRLGLKRMSDKIINQTKNEQMDWLVNWMGFNAVSAILQPLKGACIENDWNQESFASIPESHPLAEFSVTFPERDNADVDVWLKSAANTGFHDPNNLIIEFLCHWKLLKVREFSKWDEFPISDSNQLHRFCCEFYSDHWGHCEEKNSREIIKIYK